MQKGMIAGIMAVVVVLGTILSVILFARTQPLIPVMCIGVNLAYLGTLGIISMEGSFFKKIPLLVFPLVGCGMIVIPAIFMYQQSHPGRIILTEEMIPKLALGAFFLVGILLCLGSVVGLFYQRSICTEEVTATCIELVPSTGSKGATLYAPVWEYYCGGRLWTVQDPMATNVGYPQEGEERILYVDPENPEHFRTRGFSPQYILIFIGVVFMAISLISLILMGE